MLIFIGMETSGVLRRILASRGHEVVSCDWKERSRTYPGIANAIADCIGT